MALTTTIIIIMILIANIYSYQHFLNITICSHDYKVKFSIAMILISMLMVIDHNSIIYDM